MSGYREAWPRPRGSRTAAEEPAPRPLAEEFPYIPEQRRGGLRETGRHRKPGRLSMVLAALKRPGTTTDSRQP